ncbi:MAG: hypothetical protein ACYDHW_07090 [Syntrophorhabdaceae bacterium]
MLICLHCKSQSIVYDREYVAGTGYVDRPRCLKCGRDKFEDVEKTQSNISQKVAQSDHDESGTSPMQMGERLKQEGKVMHKQCEVAGCKKSGQFKGHCMFHFREVYGISYKEYLENRREVGEDPQVVALRIENVDEAARIKRGQDAKETFDKAMQEEKEKRNPEPKKPEAKAWPGEDIIAEEKAETAILITLPNSLVERIEKAALEEFRPFHMQVYYYLHHGMKAVGQ